MLAPTASTESIDVPSTAGSSLFPSPTGSLLDIDRDEDAMHAQHTNHAMHAQQAKQLRELDSMESKQDGDHESKGSTPSGESSQATSGLQKVPVAVRRASFKHVLRRSKSMAAKGSPLRTTNDAGIIGHTLHSTAV